MTDSGTANPECARPRSGTGGFTLLELLVSVAIVALLLGLLLPAVRGGIESARSFKCQANLRTITFDFTLFADSTMHPDRGNDAVELGPRRFRLETFQESQYQVDEFWAWGAQLEVRMPDAAGNDPVRCPSLRGEVVLRSNAPCTGGAVGPWQNVSFTFNIWAHRPEVIDLHGNRRTRAVALTDTWALNNPSVPLAWDVDGEEAVARDVAPFFSGPSLDSTVYADDAVWFPSRRHAGQSNFAFVDGHVSTSRAPLREAWAWKFDTPR